MVASVGLGPSDVSVPCEGAFAAWDEPVRETWLLVGGDAIQCGAGCQFEERKHKAEVVNDVNHRSANVPCRDRRNATQGQG